MFITGCEAQAKQGDPSRRDAKNTGDIRLDQPDKSAMAEHSINTGHCIDFNKTIVLDRTSCYMDRLVKETIGIRLNNQNFNRNGGLVLLQFSTSLPYRGS
jgi:hypothetical protein